MFIKKSRGGILLIFFVIILATIPQQVFAVEDFSETPSFSSEDILEKINKERELGELPPLVIDKKLELAATMKAEDMATYKYFAHTSPQGRNPWSWFRLADYSYTYAGENLAVHFLSTEKMVDAWMNSPSHCANILNPNYVETGIGIAEGKYKGQNGYFVAQVFGAEFGE